MIKSPDEELKNRIIDRIKKDGILTGRNLTKLVNDYLSPGLTIEDWGTIVENEIMIGERDNEE